MGNFREGHVSLVVPTLHPCVQSVGLYLCNPDHDANILANPRFVTRDVRYYTVLV